MNQGLLKVMSKMGISIISSYRGGYNFEAIGLSRSLCREYFPGLVTRISGIGLTGIRNRVLELHGRAFQAAEPVLAIGGFYRYRRGGEAHAYEGRLIHQLQQAVASDSYQAYKRYAEMVHASDPISIRDLVDFSRKGPPVPLDEVESITEIRKRFVTPGMSLGALGPEAHETLTIAMNRIGAKADSGEGGEGKERFTPRANGDNANSSIKQVASGRFGVTAEYLNAAKELEIKVAQGAKPGEGGQLPGFKVTVDIARLRHATPGVTLISPPPHHDIYSIEDLAQLIYDLKQINPDCQGVREAGLRGRHRHDRRRCRQGQGRRDPGLGPCRRHRRQPADLDQVCRQPLGDGPLRGQPAPDPEPPAPPRDPAHRRRHQDRARRGHRRPAGCRGVRHRHAVAGRHGLHHGPPVPQQHLPRGRVQPAAGPARQVHRHA